MNELILYTRKGCGLCDNAEQALNLLDFKYLKIDISSNKELEDLYEFDIPVISYSGKIILKGNINRHSLVLLKIRIVKELR